MVRQWKRFPLPCAYDIYIFFSYLYIYVFSSWILLLSLYIIQGTHCYSFEIDGGSCHHFLELAFYGKQPTIMKLAWLSKSDQYYLKKKRVNPILSMEVWFWYCKYTNKKIWCFFDLRFPYLVPMIFCNYYL